MKEKESFRPDTGGQNYFLTLERFAEMLGMSNRMRVLEDWIAQGKLPMRDFDGQRLVDLRAFLQLAEKGPTP